MKFSVVRKLQAFVVRLRPDGARWLLGLNLNNRPLQKWWYTTLAGRIQRGEWRGDNGEGVILGKLPDGRLVLLDGQHRLKAFLLSGLPSLDVTLITGIDPTAGLTIGLGKPRSVRDIMIAHGMLLTYKNETMSAIELCLHFPDGHTYVQHDKTTPQSAIPWLEANPGLYESVKFTAPGFPKYGAAGAAYHYLFWQECGDRAEVDRFFTKLMTGIGLAADDPVYLLRERLERARSNKAYALTPQGKAQLFTQAWNRRNEPCKRLVVGPKSPIVIGDPTAALTPPMLGTRLPAPPARSNGAAAPTQDVLHTPAATAGAVVAHQAGAAPVKEQRNRKQTKAAESAIEALAAYEKDLQFTK